MIQFKQNYDIFSNSPKRRNEIEMGLVICLLGMGQLAGSRPLFSAAAFFAASLGGGIKGRMITQSLPITRVNLQLRLSKYDAKMWRDGGV